MQRLLNQRMLTVNQEMAQYCKLRLVRGAHEGGVVAVPRNVANVTPLRFMRNWIDDTDHVGPGHPEALFPLDAVTDNYHPHRKGPASTISDSRRDAPHAPASLGHPRG